MIFYVFPMLMLTSLSSSERQDATDEALGFSTDYQDPDMVETYSNVKMYPLVNSVLPVSTMLTRPDMLIGLKPKLLLTVEVASICISRAGNSTVPLM
jgi:hypothetical protein